MYPFDRCNFYKQIADFFIGLPCVVVCIFEIKGRKGNKSEEESETNKKERDRQRKRGRFLQCVCFRVPLGQDN